MPVGGTRTIRDTGGKDKYICHSTSATSFSPVSVPRVRSKVKLNVTFELYQSASRGNFCKRDMQQTWLELIQSHFAS